MGKIARSYAVLAYLVDHPDSTAFEIHKGMSGAGAAGTSVYSILMILFESEDEKLVTARRDGTALRWKAVFANPVVHQSNR